MLWWQRCARRLFGSDTPPRSASLPCCVCEAPQVEQLVALAALAQEDEEILACQDPQVAMHGIGRGEIEACVPVEVMVTAISWRSGRSCRHRSGRSCLCMPAASPEFYWKPPGPAPQEKWVRYCCLRSRSSFTSYRLSEELDFNERTISLKFI